MRYCIVDDFIVGGNTVKRIVKEIKDKNINSELIKIYLYREPQYDEYEINDKKYPVYSFCGSTLFDKINK